ncbi:MAG: AEC family transporter [Methylobacteriaceae bacterium]|jgi:predicted permease|nr:AEC family transporter [Methylobacteriaceae bacterium]
MWLAFERAVECVLTLFLLGMVGFVLAKRGHVADETRKLLPRFVLHFCLPPYILYSVYTGFSRDELVHLFYGSFIPAASITLTFVLAALAARWLNFDKARRSIFALSCSISNTMLIGMPVNITLFGEAAVPYVLLYYFANTAFFWTVGNYSLSRASRFAGVPMFSLRNLKQVVTPPMVAVVLALTLVAFSVPLPNFVLSSAHYMGSMTTAMAMIFIGVTLSNLRFSELKVDRDIWLVMFGRFVVCPASVFAAALIAGGLTGLFPFPAAMADVWGHPSTLMLQVFIIQAGLPAGTLIPLLSAYYQLDISFATVLISLSVLLSMIVIPVTMVIVSLM